MNRIRCFAALVHRARVGRLGRRANAVQAAAQGCRRHPRCAAAPAGVVSPTRDTLLLVDVQPYPSIEVLAEPILRLAGVRINPRVGGLQRMVHYTGMTIQPLDGSPARRIALPQGASIQRPEWSYDGKKIAFARDVDDGVELWVADAATGQARPIAGARLNDVLGNPITWLSDNRHILAVLVPEGRGPAPAAPRAPIGPNVQESSGRLSQMATFQDLLTNPHDEDLFRALRDQPARSDRHRDRPNHANRSGRPDHRRRLFARREIPAGRHDSPPVLLSRAITLLHAQDRGLGFERPARRHGRRPADLRRHPPPGRADRTSRRQLAAAARRPADLDRGARRRRPAEEGRSSRQGHVARGPVHRQAQPGDGSPASFQRLRLAAARKTTPSRPSSIATAAGARPRWSTSRSPTESRKVLFDLSINDAYKTRASP